MVKLLKCSHSVWVCGIWNHMVMDQQGNNWHKTTLIQYSFCFSHKMSIFLYGIYNFWFRESARGHVTSMCGITIKMMMVVVMIMMMMMRFLDQGFWNHLHTSQKASFAPRTMLTKGSEHVEQYAVCTKKIPVVILWASVRKDRLLNSGDGDQHCHTMWISRGAQSILVLILVCRVCL